MKVAIYGQTYQDSTLDYVGELIDELEKESATISIEENFSTHLSKKLNVSNYQIFSEAVGLDSSFDVRKFWR